MGWRDGTRDGARFDAPFMLPLAAAVAEAASAIVAANICARWAGGAAARQSKRYTFSCCRWGNGRRPGLRMAEQGPTEGVQEGVATVSNPLFVMTLSPHTHQLQLCGRVCGWVGGC